VSEYLYSNCVPGGRYISGDNYVNAEGEILGPVKEEKEEDKNKEKDPKKNPPAPPAPPTPPAP